MKALSVRQPWPWLMLHGFKPVENRSWSTNYRGPLALHAGKTFDADGLASVLDAFPHVRELMPQQYDLGGFVGVVELHACVTSHPSRWFTGPYGLCVRDPKPLPFVPYRGVLGLFDIPDELLAGAIATANPGEAERLAGQERLF